MHNYLFFFSLPVPPLSLSISLSLSLTHWISLSFPLTFCLSVKLAAVAHICILKEGLPWACPMNCVPTACLSLLNAQSMLSLGMFKVWSWKACVHLLSMLKECPTNNLSMSKPGMAKAHLRHAHRKHASHSKACPEHALFGHALKRLLSHMRGERFKIKIKWLKLVEKWWKKVQGLPSCLKEARHTTVLSWSEVFLPCEFVVHVQNDWTEENKWGSPHEL